MQQLINTYTYNNQEYPLTLKWGSFKYDDLVLNIAQVRKWCEEGCPNFGNIGSCPPYSPTVDEILKDRDFTLLACKLYTKDVNVHPPQEKSKLMDNIIISFMEELGYRGRELSGTDFLTPGKCRGCSECTIESGCKSPAKRVYDITGVGIMLGDTIKKLFHEELQWFKENEEPEYIFRIMAFLPNKNSEFDLRSLL
jgi:predicted metal-binding protein